MGRKQLKTSGKAALKKHYWMYFLICLIAALLGVMYTSSLTITKLVTNNSLFVPRDNSAVVSDDAQIQTSMDIKASDVIDNIFDAYFGDDKKSDSGSAKIGILEFGKSRGIFAYFADLVSAGSPVVTFLAAGASIIMSKNIWSALAILTASLLMIFIWIFFINTYEVVMNRFFLEGRIYQKLPVNRFLYIFHLNTLPKAAMTMLVTGIFQFLWNLTIVGGIIKHYSYYMVPYIVAENPSISPLKAITLSRRMMKGHKWECFVLELSFILWYILDVLTVGLLGMFYLNMYKSATFAEYYVKIRKKALKEKIENTELLNDTYLYKYASKSLLNKTYSDVIEMMNTPIEKPKEKKGILGFFANVFGIIPKYDDEEKRYSEYMNRQSEIKAYKYAVDRKAYPKRLNPIPEKKKRKRLDHLNYLRRYSITSIILLFFSCSFIGWLWEVSLHLVKDGVFVNRGVMHGPWLPIYGAGGVCILILLNKFRHKPIFEFVAAVVLCGAVEYATSAYLEMAFHQKWWDYSGYFLNLNGRICAEGLLIFGLGGMAIVYLLAPVLDNFFRKLSLKVAIPLCISLIMIFAGDMVFSHYYPNAGKGITDYEAVSDTETSQTGINDLINDLLN